MEMQDGGKSHHKAGSHTIFWQSQWHSGIQQKTKKYPNLAATLRTVRYLLILGRSLHRIPMAQRVLYSLFPNSQHPGSQWHSDYYTDFFWQFLLTIPMAQRLLHRLLLAISFDNPNGTATVTQTSFGNLFWQSQWHRNCYKMKVQKQRKYCAQQQKW